MKSNSIFKLTTAAFAALSAILAVKDIYKNKKIKQAKLSLNALYGIDGIQKNAGPAGQIVVLHNKENNDLDLYLKMNYDTAQEAFQNKYVIFEVVHKEAEQSQQPVIEPLADVTKKA